MCKKIIACKVINLGYHQSLVNTIWLNNTLHFGLLWPYISTAIYNFFG